MSYTFWSIKMSLFRAMHHVRKHWNIPHRSLWYKSRKSRSKYYFLQILDTLLLLPIMRTTFYLQNEVIKYWMSLEIFRTTVWSWRGEKFVILFYFASKLAKFYMHMWKHILFTQIFDWSAIVSEWAALQIFSTIIDYSQTIKIRMVWLGRG